jgi:hypothetical protein
MPNWKLVDQDTGAELAVGDERSTFRNERVKIDRLQEPGDEPGDAGRVYVRFGDGSKSSSLFPGVINAEFIDPDGGWLGTGESAYVRHKFKMPIGWRSKEITLNEAEDIIARSARNAGPIAIAKWERMKGQFDAGLFLWTFSSPTEDPRARFGMEGIALFRRDEFVTHVTLARSDSMY